MEAFTNKRILPVTVLSQGRSKGDESPPDDAIAAFKHVFESIRRYKLFIVKMIGAGALLACSVVFSCRPPISQRHSLS